MTLLDLGLAMTSWGATWSVETLPLLARIGLIAREVVWLTAGFAVLAGPALGVVALAAYGGRLAARVAGTTVCIAAVVAVAGSWATFRSTGQLPGAEAVELAWLSPVQMTQHALHMEYVTALGVPLAALAGGLAVAESARRAMRLGPRGQRRLLFAVALVVVAAIAGATIDSSDLVAQRHFIAHDPASGFSHNPLELLATCRDLRTGPASRWWAEARDRIWPPPDALARWVDPALGVEHRPLVDLEAWAALGRPRPWDVVVVIVESLRPDQLLCCGGTREVMPVMEAVAREGIVYTRCYSQSSHSNYADPCVLSGHYPLREPRTHIYPPDPTYPRVLLHDLLSAHGWRTAVVSSQNEDWGRMRSYLDTGRIDHFFHAPDYVGATRIPRAEQDGGFAYFARGPVKRSGKLDDRLTVDELVRWTASLAPEQRYYCYLNLQNSHTPYEVPADFPRRFLRKPLDFEIRFSDYPRERVPDVKDAYADSLAYSDAQLGRLIEHLRRSGRWDHTLLVVTGDTGQAFFEHGFAAHANSLYEEVTRVPLVIRAPGVAPAVDDRLAQHVDVAPTVVGLLGLPPHPAHQGLDLRGPRLDARSVYLTAQCAMAHQVAIVRNGMKLIHDERYGRAAMFDLESDPDERRPILPGDSRFEALSARHGLLARLATWRRRQLDYYADVEAQRRTYPPVLAD